MGRQGGGTAALTGMCAGGATFSPDPALLIILGKQAARRTLNQMPARSGSTAAFSSRERPLAETLPI